MNGCNAQNVNSLIKLKKCKKVVICSIAIGGSIAALLSLGAFFFYHVNDEHQNNDDNTAGTHTNVKCIESKSNDDESQTNFVQIQIDPPMMPLVEIRQIISQYVTQLEQENNVVDCKFLGHGCDFDSYQVEVRLTKGSRLTPQKVTNTERLNSIMCNKSDDGDSCLDSESKLIFRFPRIPDALIKLKIEYNLLNELRPYFIKNMVNVSIPDYSKGFSKFATYNELVLFVKSLKCKSDGVDDDDIDSAFLKQCLGKYFGGYVMLQGKQLSHFNHKIKRSIFDQVIPQMAKFLSCLHSFDTSGILSQMTFAVDTNYSEMIKMLKVDSDCKDNDDYDGAKNLNGSINVPVWTTYHELKSLIDEVKWLHDEKYFENCISNEIVNSVIDDCQTILLPIWKEKVQEVDFITISDCRQGTKKTIVERGLIHGDLHFQHILMSKKEQDHQKYEYNDDDSGYTIESVIDWSDVCICDIALEFRYIWADSNKLCRKLVEQYKKQLKYKLQQLECDNVKLFQEFFDLRVEIYGFITLLMTNGFAKMLQWNNEMKRYYKNQTLLLLKQFRCNVKQVQLICD